MGRAPCCDKDGLKKGPWTPEEDQKLIDYIQKNGHGSWRTLPKNAGLARCGKSCRLRWTNYLRPDIKRGRFSFEEEETIIQLHSILGNKWSAIAARLPGRTDNEIKNYWNTHIRKRLLRMGIDPVTHTPRLDLLDLSSLLSPAVAQLGLSRLLGGIEPLLNSELLRIATNLLQSQCQNNNLFKDPQANYVPTTQQQVLPAQFDMNAGHQWHENGAISTGNFTGNFVPANNINLSYESLQHPVSNFFSEAPNFELPSNQTGSNLASVLSSTPASSQTLNNSSSIINGSTEDDKDTYCSSLFDFPDLLDVSDFM